jgi:hypothetical protein
VLLGGRLLAVRVGLDRDVDWDDPGLVAFAGASDCQPERVVGVLPTPVIAVDYPSRDEPGSNVNRMISWCAKGNVGTGRPSSSALSTCGRNRSGPQITAASSSAVGPPAVVGERLVRSSRMVIQPGGPVKVSCSKQCRRPPGGSR